MISLFRRAPQCEHSAAAAARAVADRLSAIAADDRTVNGLRARVADRRVIDQPVPVERRRRRA